MGKLIFIDEIRELCKKAEPRSLNHLTEPPPNAHYIGPMKENLLPLCWVLDDFVKKESELYKKLHVMSEKYRDSKDDPPPEMREWKFNLLVMNIQVQGIHQMLGICATLEYPEFLDKYALGIYRGGNMYWFDGQPFGRVYICIPVSNA